MNDSAPPGLRERKKRETRQHISDVATRLFAERGFDNVTVAEVAEAANVSKMTVFNYFPRKEDLFFDLEDEMLRRVTDAVRLRSSGQSPVAALGALLRDLTLAGSPLAGVSEGVSWFWRIIDASTTLRARLREMNEGMEVHLAGVLAEAVGAPPHDPMSYVVAGTVLATYRAIHRTSLLRLRDGQSLESVRKQQLELLESAFALAENGVAGTAYGGGGKPGVGLPPKKKKKVLGGT